MAAKANTDDRAFPAKTPDEIVERFANEIRSIKRQADVSGQLVALGATPTPLGPKSLRH